MKVRRENQVGALGDRERQPLWQLERPSAKRPTQGIVTVRTIGRNQDGTVVIRFERAVLVPLRGHGIEDQA